MTVLEEFFNSYNATVAPKPKSQRRSVVATFLGMVLGVIAGTTVKVWRGFKPVALSVAGLALLAGAAFTLGLGWGLAAAGLSALILEWRLNG